MEEEKVVVEETERTKKEEVQEPITMKDPKKVEAGKKLAAISKAAKEKKMRAKIEEEMEAEASKKKLVIPIPLLIGVPIIGGYLMYKYLTKEGEKRVDIVPEPKRKSPKPRSPSPPPRAKSPVKKFESFD